MFRRISRRAMLFGPALLALTLVAQPAFAATVTKTEGKVGPYQFNDQESGPRGANCDYETHMTNNKYVLDDISVRAPFVHARDTGSGNQSQKVGWWYKIQQDKEFDGTFKTVYTSSVQKKTATESNIAGFTRRTWTAPETITLSNFRVKVFIVWYKPGTTTVEQGRVVANIDWYHVKGGGNDTVRNNTCYSSNVDF